MKKIMSVLIVLLVLSGSTMSFASGITSSDKDSLGIQFDIKDLQNAKEISFEDVVKERMISENMSYDESLELMLKEEEVILQNFAEQLYQSRYLKSYLQVDKDNIINKIKENIEARDIINYVDYIYKFSYDQNRDFKAQLEVKLRIVKDYGNSYYIDGVMGDVTSRGSAGLFNYQWKESASGDELARDKKSIYLWTRGYFTVETSSSANIGISIPGFDMGGGMTTNHEYRSETVSEHKTYYVR